MKKVLLKNIIISLVFISNTLGFINNANSQCVNPVASCNGPICEGEDLNLTANTIPNATYTWTGPNSFSFSGQNATILNATVNETGEYILKVDQPGCATLFDLVDVIISPPSSGGTISGSQTVCSGNNKDTLILGGWTGDIIRWEYSYSGESPWYSIGNTSKYMEYTNLTQTTYFRAVVQSGSCASVISDNKGIITVNPSSVGGTISGGGITVCYNNNSGTLSLINYKGDDLLWEYSENSGLTWVETTNTTNTYHYNNLTITTQYRVKVKSGNCDSSYSNTTTITVNQESIGGVILGSTTVCSGNNNTTLTLSGNNGEVLRWESSLTGNAP